MTPAPARDIRPLTALRFMAALWVALYAFWPNLQTAFAPNLVVKGYLGVELFFILSGFILSHVYLDAFAERRFSYRDFLGARLARVYPLHLFTLFGVMALGLAAGVAGVAVDASVLSWETLLPNLLMVHAWGFAGEAGWNHPSWSISAEWFAYLVFPVFAAGAWAFKDRPWIAVGVAAALLLIAYAVFERLAGFPLTEATFRWGALRILPCFAYGCALNLAYRRAPLRRGGLVALGGAIVMILTVTAPAWDAAPVLAGGCVILGLASMPAGGCLGSRPAVWLGEISYALYMVCAPWQMLAVNLLARAASAEDKRLPLWLWLCMMAGLIAAAAAAHHLVERPARRVLRAWLTRRRPVDDRPKQLETVLQPSDTIV